MSILTLHANEQRDTLARALRVSLPARRLPTESLYTDRGLEIYDDITRLVRSSAVHARWKSSC